MPKDYSAALDRLEGWVVKNSGWLALGIVAGAFALRFSYAACCYLNPDEGTHFAEARPSSWLAAFEASRHNPHPPLSVMILHGMLFFGRTELALRLPSIIAGTAALWVCFAWIRRNLGGLPALMGLGFLALSPAAISASTEVREYGLLLFFVSVSLYATDRALAERSTSWAIILGISLVGALLTHYMAIVPIASLAIYILACWLSGEASRRVIFIISASYAVLAILLAWLYLSQVRGHIQHGSSVQYLHKYYYTSGADTPLGFLWRTVFGTFAYEVGARRFAVFVFLVFLAGLAAMLTRRTKARRLMTLLVITPFAVGLAAAIAQIFPFGGSRHQAYLLPFIAAGIGSGLAWLHSQHAILVLLLATALAPLWIVTHSAPDNDCRLQPIRDMTTAMEYVRQTVPRGALLFVDVQTHESLTYYLGRSDPSAGRLQPRPDSEEAIGGYGVVIARELEWAFRPDEVLSKVKDSTRILGVPPGQPLWVISTAWLEPSLASRLPVGPDRDVREFGRITVIKIISGDSMYPDTQ